MRVTTRRDTPLAAGLDPAALLDGDTLYQRLAAAGVPSTVLQPSAFSPSTYDGVATRGAQLRPFGSFAEGVDALVGALQRPRLCVPVLGPDRRDGPPPRAASREFDAAAIAALDTLERGLRAVPGALLMVTADHGQVAVDPARVDYLDELWNGLPALLRHGPAGSGPRRLPAHRPRRCGGGGGRPDGPPRGARRGPPGRRSGGRRALRHGRPAPARAARRRLRAARTGPDRLAALGGRPVTALPRPPRRPAPGRDGQDVGRCARARFCGVYS